MNKKILLLLPLASLILSGCVMYNGKDPNASADDSQSTDTTSDTTTSEDNSNSSSTSSGSETPVTPDTPNVPTGQVTTYLVLGEYGLYQGEKGSDVESLFLENTITLTATVGNDLPGKDDVTSTSNSTFKYWQAYEGGGAPVVYSSVPAEDGKILYAVFEDGDGSSSVTPAPDDGLPKSGYGLYFADKSYVVGTLQDSKDEQGRTQYLIKNYTFKKDAKFTIYDFGNQKGWVENLDGYSFGGSSASSTYWQKYLSKSTSFYTVLVDFFADIYLKMQYEDNLIYFERTDSNPPVDGGDTTPTTDSSFGLNFLDGNKIKATKLEGEGAYDSESREQYKITGQAFSKDQQFQLWDFANSAGWVIAVDPYSFGDSSGSNTVWQTYLSKGDNYYTVKVDFTVDVYIKIKNNNDQIYFGKPSSSSVEEGGSTTSDETTTTDKITVYFAGVENWTDMNLVNIGLTESDLALCSKTTGDDTTKGQYKRSITSSIASNTLHMYFTNTSNQYRHPINIDIQSIKEQAMMENIIR